MSWMETQGADGWKLFCLFFYTSSKWPAYVHSNKQGFKIEIANIKESNSNGTSGSPSTNRNSLMTVEGSLEILGHRG